MTAITTTELTRRLTRRLPRLEGDQLASGTRLAELLLSAGASMPSGCRLLIGGSLSRGEPSLNSARGGQTHFSDLDLLVVHDSSRPPSPREELVAAVRRHLPDADLMLLRLDAYRRLPTSLGFDFKENGCCLNGDKPEFTPVPLTQRDAYEICIYALFIWIWSGLARKEAECRGGELEVAYGHSRVVLKLLRTAAMLHGNIGHHDRSNCPPWLADALAEEAAFHDDPLGRPPPPPTRVLRVARVVLEYHEGHHGGRRDDAVTGTRYEPLRAAGYVAEQQRLALSLIRKLIDSTDDATPASRLEAALLAAWDDVVREANVARPTHTPEEYFSARKLFIQDQLLEMKIRWATSGDLQAVAPPATRGGLPWD